MVWVEHAHLKTPFVKQELGTTVAEDTTLRQLLLRAMLLAEGV
jgi:hypothetical protein